MKIIIRDYKLSDLKAYEQWCQPDKKWHKTNGPYYPPRSTSEIRNEVKKLRSDIVQDSFPYPRTKMLIINEDNDELIGTVSSYWTSEETQWLTMGICIFNENYWGLGIGELAFTQWIDYLFKHRPEIVRLDLRTWSGNIGMIKLSTKLGFTQEACFRNARIVNGEYYDSLGYGILREEWESKRKSL